VRPPRRQGARPDEPVRPHARVRAARRGRARRPHRPRRAHRRPLRDPAHERRRRARPRVHHWRADARGLLPHRAGDRRSDRARPCLRALRGRPLVRDLDPGSRRSWGVRRGRPRAVPRQAARLQLLAVLQLAQAPRRPHDRVVPARAGRDGLQVPVRDACRLPRGLQLDVRPRTRLRVRGHERIRAAAAGRVRQRGAWVHRDSPSARGRCGVLRRGARGSHRRSSTLALKGSTEEAQFEEARVA
jgi:hypothetical protein